MTLSLLHLSKSPGYVPVRIVAFARLENDGVEQERTYLGYTAYDEMNAI